MEQKNKFNLPYVVIFIPAYNEEGAIGKTIDSVKEELIKEKYKEFYFETIVIDDGSKDKTGEIAKNKGIKVVTLPINMGLGAATRTGMRTAYEMGADIAVKVDGDAQFVMEDLDKMIKPILENKADVIFGSRFLGSILYKMPFHRAWGNTFFAWLTSRLTGMKVTDSSTGLISFCRRYLSCFGILMDYNETQQLIIDAWGKDMRVIEIPISSNQRKSGKSFVNWKYPFRVLPAMLRSYIHARPLKSFFCIGLFIFIIGVAIGFLWFFGISKFFGGLSSAILIITGIQIILFGFLADIVIKKR